MTLQLIDTTSGAGDTGKVGGDKINANMREAYQKTRRFSRRVASRAISGKHSLRPLSDAGLTYSNVSCATTGVTFNIRVAAPGPFEAVRVLIPNVAAAPVTGVKVGLCNANASGGWASNKPVAGGNIGTQVASNPNNQAADTPTGQWLANAGAYLWGKMFFADGTKTEIDLPPALDGRNDKMLPSWTATDWTPLTPAARTDGGTLPLVDIRIQYPPTAHTPASGAAASSPGVTTTEAGFANWGIDGALASENDRPFNKGHLWRVFSEPALGVDTGINFQGSNNPLVQPRGVPIIVQFRMAGEVITFLYANDSIGEINDFGERGNSYAFRGAMAAAAATGKVVSWCPITWPSGPITAYGRECEQLIDLIRPSIFWIKPIGPNETTTSPLLQRHYDGALLNLGFCLNIGEKYNSRVIIEPHLATRGDGAYAWGTSDAIRRNWNDAYKAAAATRGFTFADLDPALIAGGTPLNGQNRPFPTATDDGVHLAEPGHEALKAPATTAATAAINLD